MTPAATVPLGATVQPAMGAATADRLPPLREDLVLSQGAKDRQGRATWQIYDPLRHRFIAIDHATFVILSLWRDQTTVSGLAKAAVQALGQAAPRATFEGLVRFLTHNNLLTQGPDHDWRGQVASARAHHHGFVMSLVHNYLFFRIPLFAPELFLRRTRWFADLMFTRTAVALIAAIGVAGLFLVSRQWDEFLRDARGLASIEGAAQFGIALFLLKILHEFGHAYAADRYGCRVPVMGLAFMMMAPILYTDVTDAWRLPNRRQRLVIDAAGVMVELAVACIATFVWVFLPEGTPRQMAFLIATTSWVTSIAINLNPLMRFDGYYIFADLLGIENLQSRAFAVGTWRLREVLFGLKAPSPESLRRPMLLLLIAYAWTIWIYRLVLFTGIAAAVYAYFFKALGVILFLFEIGYFIARPVVKEVGHWWQNRRAVMVTPRSRWTLGIVVAGLVLFFLPWSTTITVPAILEAADVARLFAPRPARIIAIEVQVGQAVKKGDRLMRLEALDLESERLTTAAKLAVIAVRLDRMSADKTDREDSQVLESQRAALLSRMQGLDRERQELVIRAPIDGIVGELSPQLQAGRWISQKEQLALVHGDGHALISGYVAEPDLGRIDTGAKGRFIPDAPLAASVPVTLSMIAISSTRHLEFAELSSVHGGRIDASADARQRLVPSGAQYGATFAVADRVPNLVLRQRGLVHVTGRAESYFSAVWRRVLKVIVRESSA